MGAESFVGPVNALYGRLDEDARLNSIRNDPSRVLSNYNALVTNSALRDQAIRENQADMETRNALKGVNSLNDLPDVLPSVIRSDPRMGLNMLQGLSNIDLARQSRTLQQQQLQAKFLNDAYEMLASVEAEPDESLRPAQYQAMLRRVVGTYPGVANLIGKAIPEQYDPAWSKTTMQSLIPAVERYKASMAYPKFENIQQGDENVTYRTFPGGGMQEIGRGSKWSDREGLAVTLPDGTSISSGGRGKITSTGLQPTTQKKVEEDLLDQTANLAQLKQIRERFDPQFATYFGQAKGSWLRFKQKAGSDLSGQEKDFASKFYSYRSEAGQMQADIMRRMSGTAVTPTEESRQKTYLIDPGTGVFDGDSAEQVNSKLDRFEKFTRRSVARLNYIRKNGISIRTIPLNDESDDKRMDRIIQDRAEIIEGKLRAQGIPKDKLAEETARQTAEYFGLVY